MLKINDLVNFNLDVLDVVGLVVTVFHDEWVTVAWIGEDDFYFGTHFESNLILISSILRDEYVSS